jgi:hypothetical protein
MATKQVKEKETSEVEVVAELTDKAIAVELAKLERMAATRAANITDLNAEIEGYESRCVVLRRVQIQRIEARIEAKLPLLQHRNPAGEDGE